MFTLCPIHVNITLVPALYRIENYRPNKRIYCFGVLNVSTEPIGLICFTKCETSQVYRKTAGGREGVQFTRGNRVGKSQFYKCNDEGTL